MCWIRAGGWLSAWGWGNYLKYLKRGCNRNEGRRNKDFKKGASWVKGSVSPKGGGWNPLTNYVMYWYFTTNLISGKILVLDFWTNMLLASQIAGFFKLWYLKSEMNDEVYFWHTDKHGSLLQVDTIMMKLIFAFR